MKHVARFLYGSITLMKGFIRGNGMIQNIASGFSKPTMVYRQSGGSKNRRTRPQPQREIYRLLPTESLIEKQNAPYNSRVVALCAGNRILQKVGTILRKRTLTIARHLAPFQT
ncbi:hypothetical protein AB4Y38_25170 [Paraburkholderia sp. EG285A]|uniref:hypothetical protein n=1 Tax=Paraburkholderia sp. EG285A TaxID=3237009 RepID=UPI0034D2CB3B